MRAAVAKHASGLTEARAVPSAFAGEGAALCYAKGISAATGRESSSETVGPESVKLTRGQLLTSS